MNKENHKLRNPVARHNHHKGGRHERSKSGLRSQIKRGVMDLLDEYYACLDEEEQTTKNDQN